MASAWNTKKLEKQNNDKEKSAVFESDFNSIVQKSW
jgi:hypothetical protein